MARLASLTDGLKVERPADPTGVIAKVRGRMPRDCSVRQSAFCDHIIAMRMQGVSYGKIAAWLVEQDPNEFIPPGTLFRNLKKGFGTMQVQLPLYEEKADKWGGSLHIDVEREVAGAILLQRGRLDRMLRMEGKIQKEKPGYRDTRLRGEMELLTEQLALLHEVQKDLTAVNDAKKQTEKALHGSNLVLTAEAETLMLSLVLQGKIGLSAERVIDGELIESDAGVPGTQLQQS